jgi:phage FluMu gp28-like protein
MPIISRGHGGITIASTPLGKSGVHWMILAESSYRGLYSFFTVYWWNCPEFVADGKFDEAQGKCPSLPTARRVQKYGSNKLRHIFLGMDIESFCQEYECHHIDESVSYFPMGLINRCVFRVPVDDIFDEPDENAEDVILKTQIEEMHPGIVFKFYDNIDDMLNAIKTGVIKGRFIGGFDVGRKHHTAELVLVEEVADNLNIVRLRRCFRKETFETMKEEINYVIRNCSVRKFGIDATGPGIQLAEEMRQKYPGICEEINFSNSWKDESASNLRRLMESQWLAIPDKRDFKSQFHSIKRMVTEHGNFKIDAEKNKDHHGDIFWAVAMATMYVRNIPVIGFNVAAGKYQQDSDPGISSRIVRPSTRLFMPNSPMARPFVNFGSDIGFGVVPLGIVRKNKDG